MATKFVSTWYNNVETLPADYVMPPERRAGKFEVCKDIPIIDLGQLEDHGASTRADLVRQVSKAIREFGLFQVINHGVSKDLMEETMKLYRVFFDSEVGKVSAGCEESKKGWQLFTSSLIFGKEDAHYWKDTLLHACHPLEDHKSSWPEKPTNYRDVVGRYAVEVRKVGLRICELVFEGLGLKEGYTESELIGQQLMAIHNYPPCPDPSLAMGLGGHTDSNIITLVQQDVCGLQFLKDGQWLGVEAIPDAFVVNGGYALQMVSNGTLVGAQHRVVTNSDAARTSITTFLDTAASYVIKPAKDLVAAAGGSAKFKPVPWKEFLDHYVTYRTKEQLPAGTPLDYYKL